MVAFAMAATADPGAAASSNVCADGSMASDDSCTPAAAYDSYRPAATLGTDAAAEPPRIQHMWTTPLFITQPRFRDVAAFNRALSQRALDAFEALLARDAADSNNKIGTSSSSATANDPSQLHRGDSAAGANERFFAWQRDQHALGSRAEPAYLELVRSSEWRGLLSMFDSYARAFLESLDKGALWPPASSSRPPLFCWAAIARDGNSHLSHTHPDNLLSGVYYARVPASGAGALLFDDPRGPRWPFDGRFIHRPQAGELVLFPSWLVHQVTPTTSADHETRVAFSCNVPGSWEDTADINLV